jgi:hypothetical protein
MAEVKEGFETTNASLLDANNTGDQSAEIAAHTPTPWKFRRSDWMVVQQDGKNNWHIAEIKPQGMQTYANAAFIVRAVNAHEDLVAALKEGAECLQAVAIGKGGWAWEEVLETMHAALAKATSTGK